MAPKLQLIQKSSSSWLLCAEKWLSKHQTVPCRSLSSRPTTKLSSHSTVSSSWSNTSAPYSSLDAKFTRLRVSTSSSSSFAATSFKAKSTVATTTSTICTQHNRLGNRSSNPRRRFSTSTNSTARTAQESTSSPSASSSVGGDGGGTGIGGALSGVNRALEQVIRQVPMLFSNVSNGLVDIWKTKIERRVSVDATSQQQQKQQPPPALTNSDGEVAPATTSNEKDVKAKDDVRASAVKVPVVTKTWVETRARFLVAQISSADSNMAYYTRIEELGKFLRSHPEAQAVVTKVGAVRQLMLAKQGSADPSVHEASHEVLALLGYCKPPSGWGVRILSIDGGGLRGIMALEILHQLEELTGQPVHRLFDYICGVSTGAVLAVLLGALKSTVPRCEDLYRHIGAQIFTQNTLWGTGKLVMNHAFFDTDNWTRLVREHIGERLLSETPRDPTCPKFSAISTVVSRPRMEAFLFRNYEYPPRVRSVYPGTNAAHLWQAVRASAAAPGYFEEFNYADEIHQDGGILINNPTALALHECKQLWPGEAVQCVISLGSGRYEPQHAGAAQKYTGLKDKVMKIIDSATDTEAVHTILHDLLPPNVYFRINPYLSENIPLHEARSEKILKLQEDARMYLRRNETKLKTAAELLQQPRGRLQRAQDFLSQKSSIYFG